MDIKVGDYVTLRSWEEVKDGNTLSIGEKTWNHLCEKPRKVLEINCDLTYSIPSTYLVEDEGYENPYGWFVLESAIASVRRDFK